MVKNELLSCQNVTNVLILFLRMFEIKLKYI
jgi:hypothetical protein